MKPKILIARLSAFGDVVRTVPAVKAIRENFQGCEIHWLVEDRYAPLIEGLSYVDKLVIVPRKDWQSLPLGKRPRSFFSFIQKLRTEHYDIYIDFHGVLKSGVYGRLAGIPRRIGYPPGISKELNTLFTNEKISAIPRRMSRYERNFLIPRHFNACLEQTRADLPISEEDRSFAASFLKAQGLRQKDFVFMFPGTSAKGIHKRWMPENYGKLIDFAYEKWNLPTVIGWGPGEEEIVGAVQPIADHKPIILPQITAKQLCAVIEKALIFLGGDTGPMHMASMVGTPVVTIFGPSDLVINEPARFTPFRIVSAEIDCSPCRKRNCRELDCLHAVSVEMVAEAISSLLSDMGFNNLATEERLEKT